MMAARYDNVIAAEVLINAGADLKMTNAKGQTALDIATLYDAEQCISLFNTGTFNSVGIKR
jgi:ankyrin repeat protein